MTLKDRIPIHERDALALETGGTEAEKAVQWAVQSRKVVNGFERMCSGKLWVPRLGASTTCQWANACWRNANGRREIKDIGQKSGGMWLSAVVREHWVKPCYLSPCAY